MDVFIDTKILVYGHDADAGDKHRHAENVVDDIWRNRRMPAVSIQVLQEMHVNLVRKGIAIDVSAALVSRYLSWRVVENGKDVFRRSLEIQRRWQLSYWDSLIVAAALRAQAKELWTEDLNTDQVIEGMSIRNPVRASQKKEKGRAADAQKGEAGQYSH